MIEKIRGVRARVQVSFIEAKHELEGNGFDVEAAVQGFLASGRLAVASPDPAAVAAASEPAPSVAKWVESELRQYQPGPVVFGSVGAKIASLVSVVYTLEVGGSELFGMHVDRYTLTTLRPLAAVAREYLAGWRTQLIEQHGAEGAKLVDTIAARGEITLPWMTSSVVEVLEAPPSAEEQSVLDRLTAAQAAGLVKAGAADVSHMREFAARYRAAQDSSLPAPYLRLLARFNGIEVAFEDDRFSTPVVAPQQLSEPVLYPLDVGNDHFLLDDVDLQSVATPFVFGEICDSGYVLFDAAHADAPVFWIPRHFSREPAVPLTASLLEFLSTWADADWSLRGVLRRCKVPGWSS